MEDEQARRELSADFPDWRIWRAGQLVMAWLPGTNPPLRLYADSVAALREQISEYVAPRAAP